MEQTCKRCGGQFEVSAFEQALLKKLSPVCGSSVLSLPPPSMCPECRKQRRLSFRNERNLYQRSCSCCGKKMVSVYSPDKRVMAACSDCWWKAEFEALRPKDLSALKRPFFEVFGDLLRDVPSPGLWVIRSENSEYTNLAGANKNCYLIFNSEANEDCLYSRGIRESRDCLDVYFGAVNELCYECVNCHNSFNLLFSQNCYNSRDSAFLLNCDGCANCLCSTNLKHKQYYVFNRDCGKVGYEEAIKELGLSRSGVSRLNEAFSEVIGGSFLRSDQNIDCEQCSGDYLVHCKNCRSCFETYSSEDCCYCDCAKVAKDCADIFGYGVQSELLYQSVAVGRSQCVLFSITCSGCNDLVYCAFCEGSHDLLGCAGLHRKSYCIFNMQFSKEEYQELAPRVIEQINAKGEWGDFAPPWISPYGYNESVASEYYPLTREDALSGGYNWSVYEPPPPQVDKFLRANELPERIEDTDDNVLDSAIICEQSGRPFRLTKLELTLYRKLGVPIPAVHPDERHKRRLVRRNPHRLNRQVCDHCGRSVSSTYLPESASRLYCPECYAGAVF